jgi:hypothetical protein
VVVQETAETAPHTWIFDPPPVLNFFLGGRQQLPVQVGSLAVKLADYFGTNDFRNF